MSDAHTLIGFANPFLICSDCRESVRYWHDPVRCGCKEGTYNHPCKHKAVAISICHSWSPVDDCSCVDKTTHDS
jgi:hypothetical protein